MSSRKSSCNQLVPVTNNDRKKHSKNKLTGAYLSPGEQNRSRRSPSRSRRSTDDQEDNDDRHSNRALQVRDGRNNRRDLMKYGGKPDGRRSRGQMICEEFVESEVRNIQRTTKRMQMRYDDYDSSSDNSSSDASSSGCDNY